MSILINVYFHSQTTQLSLDFTLCLTKCWSLGKANLITCLLMVSPSSGGEFISIQIKIYQLKNKPVRERERK